jgi:hypothetical protein
MCESAFMGFFGVLSGFGRRVKGMILLRPEQVWTGNKLKRNLYHSFVDIQYTHKGQDMVVPFVSRARIPHV